MTEVQNCLNFALTLLYHQAISQQWCGRAPRNLESGRPEHLTAFGLWWPDTSLLGTGVPRKTLKTTCCQLILHVRCWSHYDESQRHSCGHFNTETSEEMAKTEIQQHLLGPVERPL